MLGDKQEQSAQTGSFAIQAGRDVNYHGLSVADVRELCALFLRSNFPQLQQEARQTAEQHVQEFASTLEKKLINKAESIVLDKFRDPDVQAAINDAVQASARKGLRGNPQVLSTLIAERVALRTNDFKDVVLSEAVTVAPKLTSQQISLLSFHHFVTAVKFNDNVALNEIDQIARLALAAATPGFNLSLSQKQHIQYSSACALNHLVGGDVYEELRQKFYSHFGFTDTTALKAAIATQAPAYAILLNQFNQENLFTITLTSVGKAIAIANLSNYLGQLDYSIWLN